MKAEAIQRLTDARIFTTLAMVVAQGVNDHEIGAVADFAFATDYIAGVAYQPVFGSGRANPIDPMHRMTTTGVLKRLGPQTGGRADRRGLHRPAVQPPGLLRDHLLRAGGRRGRIGPSRSCWGSSA